LGGNSFELFRKVLRDYDNINIKILRQQLKLLLKLNFGFSDDYAEWLPNHMEHLNSGSLDILNDLNPEEFEHVRYSTIVSIKSSSERN